MPVGAQRVVLGRENTLDGTHQRAALARQVGVNLPLEVGFEQVARTYADAQRHHAFECAPRGVLEYGVARIQAAALEEHAAQRSPRAFRGDQDHVYVGRRHDARALLVGDAEAVREVERLARREVFLDRRPYGDLPGVGEQVLDDRCAPGGLFDPEERLARYPAVGDGLVPAFRAFALSDDDVEPVVLEVERLPRPLYAVADYGDGFVPEDFACFFQGKLFAGNDLLFYSAEIDLCHSCMNFKS